ncbi:MAG: CdiI family contact-dependent growth inhibition immunity protein [Holosporaceae bacterium]|jgi:hypothetical protein|nr:CdiI family contact-dependent growth inhibition immunity protein [Holosporaceae bacterium]
MEKHASVYCNTDFFELYTESKSGSVCAQDPKGVDIYLSSEDGCYNIGSALTTVLEKSRVVGKNDPDYNLFDISAITGRYKDFVEYVLQKYNYKNKHAMFKNMQHCSVKMDDGIIVISPWKHDKLEGYDGMNESFNLTIPSTSTPSVIGAAVKYSIARCTGRSADLVAKKLFPGGVPDTFEDYLQSLNLQKA